MRNPISPRHTVHATWLLEVWHNVLTRVKYLILWKKKKWALSLTSCAMLLACKQVSNHPPHSLTLNHKKKKISERVANYFPRLRTMNVYVYMYIYIYRRGDPAPQTTHMSRMAWVTLPTQLVWHASFYVGDLIYSRVKHILCHSFYSQSAPYPAHHITHPPYAPQRLQKQCKHD